MAIAINRCFLNDFNQDFPRVYESGARAVDVLVAVSEVYEVVFYSAELLPLGVSGDFERRLPGLS